MTDTDLFKATHVNTDGQWPRMKFCNVLAMADAMLAIKACCTRVLPDPVPPHVQRHMDCLPGLDSSLAQVRRMIVNWHKWTGKDGPTLSTVSNFLAEWRRDHEK